MQAIRTYFVLTLSDVRSQMQYRASFAMQTLGNFLASCVDFLGIAALFSSFGALQGWSLYEVAVLYGIVNLSFALAEGIGRGFDVFARTIREGNFDRVLLRPRGTLFQVLASRLEISRVGRLLQGRRSSRWALRDCPSPWGWARDCCAGRVRGRRDDALSGVLFLQAAACFWTLESLEVFNILNLWRPPGRRLSAGHLPGLAAELPPLCRSAGVPELPAQRRALWEGPAPSPRGAPTLRPWRAPRSWRSARWPGARACGTTAPAGAEKKGGDGVPPFCPLFLLQEAEDRLQVGEELVVFRAVDLVLDAPDRDQARAGDAAHKGVLPVRADQVVQLRADHECGRANARQVLRLQQTVPAAQRLQNPAVARPVRAQGGRLAPQVRVVGEARRAVQQASSKRSPGA